MEKSHLKQTRKKSKIREKEFAMHIIHKGLLSVCIKSFYESLRKTTQ